MAITIESAVNIIIKTVAVEAHYIITKVASRN